MKAKGIEALPWDSSWLGFPVARFAAGAATSQAEVLAAIQACQAAGIRLLYLVLQATAAEAAAAMLNTGAEQVDTKLIYELRLPVDAPLADWPAGIELSCATRPTPALDALARRSGEYSRFRRDARIGSQAFAELYHQWLRQTLAQGVVWTATEAGEPLGLLAFSSFQSQARIELLAVAPQARRRRIGRSLVSVAIQEAQRCGLPLLQVTTQQENRAACQLYEQCCFRLRQAEHIYHLWL